MRCTALRAADDSINRYYFSAATSETHIAEPMVITEAKHLTKPRFKLGEVYNVDISRVVPANSRKRATS